MSKRVDITNQIFGDIYVLEFEQNENTHALYKCLCMQCNEIFHVTYCNLKYKNTRSCKKCGQKKTNYSQEFDINQRLINGESAISIAKDLDLGRSVVDRIKREWHHEH